VVFALKNYARVEHRLDRQPVDVRARVETALKLHGRQIKQDIEVQREFADTLPRCEPPATSCLRRRRDGLK
jgi:hypothetical protein